MGFSSLKASSSSDTSDDDDDPMVKIDFKINPKLLTPSETPLADEDHQAKIMNAMRLVEQSMGNIAMNSRGPARVRPSIAMLSVKMTEFSSLERFRDEQVSIE